MTKFASSIGAIVLALAAFFCAEAAQAQAHQTFVSHTGDDSNICYDPTQPCLTLLGAYGKTAADGEIDIMDTGEYDALTITQAITIANDSAGVASTRGLIVNAASTDGVILRGLTFYGVNNSPNGITANSVNALVVDHCAFQGYSDGAAILFAPSNAAKLQVIDSVLAFNGTSSVGAIQIAPASGGSVSANIERVRVLNGGGNGIRVDNSAHFGALHVELHDVTVDGSAGGSGIVAVSATSGGAPSVIVADNVTATGNAGYGLRAVGGAAKIFMRRSTIANNGNGIGVSSGGAIVSYSDNAFADNANGDGSATSTLALK